MATGSSSAIEARMSTRTQNERKFGGLEELVNGGRRYWIDNRGPARLARPVSEESRRERINAALLAGDL
jgi:hypothetical protein